MSVLPLPALAHDIYAAATSPALRLVSDAIRKTPPTQKRTRGVLYNIFVWDAPRALTVCFMDGDEDTRDKTQQAMKRWRLAETTDNRMRFTFLPRVVGGNGCLNRNADIRISFNGSAYWSAIGKGSHHASLLLGASMYLGGLTAAKWSAESDRVVVHETGHALGLLHEHQHKARDCDDPWDRDWILDHTGWTTMAQLAHELDGLERQDQRAYTFLTYDRLSVMNYWFGKEAYKPGFHARCAAPFRDRPSDQDLDSVRFAYSEPFQQELNGMRGNPALLAGPIYDELRAYMSGE